MFFFLSHFVHDLDRERKSFVAFFGTFPAFFHAGSVRMLFPCAAPTQLQLPSHFKTSFHRHKLTRIKIKFDKGIDDPNRNSYRRLPLQTPPIQNIDVSSSWIHYVHHRNITHYFICFMKTASQHSWRTLSVLSSRLMDRQTALIVGKKNNATRVNVIDKYYYSRVRLYLFSIAYSWFWFVVHLSPYISTVNSIFLLLCETNSKSTKLKLLPPDFINGQPPRSFGTKSLT